MSAVLLLFFALTNFLSLPVLADQREKERVFIKKMGVCLKKKDPVCLKELVASKVFSPDGHGFGCKMTEKGGSHISAENFADCVFKSEAKDNYCSMGTTLFQAMSECFTLPKASHTEDGYIEGAGGYLCYLVVDGDKVLLRSIMCGP